MSAKLISIIGPPAAGKTTLAEHLAAELPAGLILEDYAGNPFLAESYAASPHFRLPAQLHFLMSRVGQLSRSTWPADGLVVCDYGFCQDRIYAADRLSKVDMLLYDQVSCRLEGLVHQPGLIIHLDAPATVLLERIAQRGRDFEKTMTDEFISSMRQAYNEIIAPAGCRIIRIDSRCNDLRAQDSPARIRLVAMIREKQ